MRTSALARDIAIVLALKVLALCLIYWMCFSVRPHVDTAAHIVSSSTP